MYSLLLVAVLAHVVLNKFCPTTVNPIKVAPQQTFYSIQKLSFPLTIHFLSFFYNFVTLCEPNCFVTLIMVKPRLKNGHGLARKKTFFTFSEVFLVTVFLMSLHNWILGCEQHAPHTIQWQEILICPSSNSNIERRFVSKK
jgi:hypothetical protein